MTAVELGRIEAALGLGLPPAYRALMLAYPPFLRAAHYRSPVGGRASDALLFADPDRVIAYNRDWQDDGFLVGEDDTERRPDRHLIIGEDGGGNCWCVKLGSDGEAVWAFDHEDGSLKQATASLEEHVEFLRSLLAEIDRESVPEAAGQNAQPGATPGPVK